MGRPLKNPDHVLVRLREAISTPNRAVTRKDLAERSGVSHSTLRQIEIGKFRLTEGIARRLMVATGVASWSLLKGENPLKDILGEELSAESRSDIFPLGAEISMFDMLDTALIVAKEKKRAAIFYQLFNGWLPEAVAAIGALSTMKKALNRNLGLFDTYYVPRAFRPTDSKMKKLWLESWEELTAAVGEKAGEKASGEARAQAYQEVLNARRGDKRPLPGKRDDLSPDLRR